MRIDFGGAVQIIEHGTVTAGKPQVVGPYEIYNASGATLTRVEVVAESVPEEDTLQLSDRLNPFTPLDTVVFEGEFPPGAKIGDVYVLIDAPIVYVDEFNQKVANEGIKEHYLVIAGR